MTTLFRGHRFPKLAIRQDIVDEVIQAIDAAELNRSEREVVRKHLRTLSGDAPDKSENPFHFSTVLAPDDAVELNEEALIADTSRAALVRDILHTYLQRKGAA